MPPLSASVFKEQPEDSSDFARVHSGLLEDIGQQPRDAEQHAGVIDGSVHEEGRSEIRLPFRCGLGDTVSRFA